MAPEVLRSIVSAMVAPSDACSRGPLAPKSKCISSSMIERTISLESSIQWT